MLGKEPTAVMDSGHLRPRTLAYRHFDPDFCKLCIMAMKRRSLATLPRCCPMGRSAWPLGYVRCRHSRNNAARPRMPFVHA